MDTEIVHAAFSKTDAVANAGFCRLPLVDNEETFVNVTHKHQDLQTLRDNIPNDAVLVGIVLWNEQWRLGADPDGTHTVHVSTNRCQQCYGAGHFVLFTSTPPCEGCYGTGLCIIPRPD